MSLPGYVDYLKRVDAAGGPFAWVRQTREFPSNCLTKNQSSPRSPQDIVAAVLRSPRVQDAIGEVERASAKPRQEVIKKSVEIIETMAHSFDLTSVRCVGYAIVKVVRMIFDAILVNSDELRRIREIWKETPVVFIPTHRTYMDFLLISLLCFDQEVPLPAIAAAMDFMNSRFIGEALRVCGAFFIRRAVGEDKLYWAIFTEYAQTHIVNADRPVEFFIEGTRSRVGKSIAPRYGLLQLLLEPYLRGNVYDMVIVPVAINYDKILEEQLYAYELLGFPKPKESATGLLKARRILGQSFGKAVVTFCEPISIRQHFGHSIKRSVFVCQPDSQFKMTERERKAIRKFGHDIVAIHNQHSRFDVWPLAALTLLNRLDNKTSTSITYSELCHSVLGMLELMGRLNLSAQIYKSVDEDLLASLRLHSDIFMQCNMEADDFTVELLSLPVEKKSGTVPVEFLQTAIVPIILANHANMAMHAFAPLSILSLVLTNEGSGFPLQKYSSAFKFIRHLLYREFIHEPELDDFAEYLQVLEAAQFVRVCNGDIQLLCDEQMETLAALIEPNISLYPLVARVLLSIYPLQPTIIEACRLAQETIYKLISSGTMGVRLTFFSTESLKNVFNTFVDAGCLRKNAKNYTINRELLERLSSQIAEYSKLSVSSSKAKL